MAGNPIRSLFEKQIHKENVQNCNPTRAVQTEMLKLHELESNAAETQLEYIILDDEGYMVNNFNDINYVQDSVNLEKRAATTQSQHANIDFIILDENNLIIDAENDAGKCKVKVNMNIY